MIWVLSFEIGNYYEIQYAHCGFCPKNHGEGGSEQVRFRPLEPFDDSVERFFASLRFEQRGKLDQLGVEIGSFE